MTGPQFLSDVMDHAHGYTLQHLERLKDSDLHHRFEVQGHRLNSAFWIVGHLAVSQNWLILRGTGGPFQKFSWAKQFTLGATAPEASECPPWEEVLATYQRIHALAMTHVSGLDEDLLSAPHQGMLKVGDQESVRGIIKHHIRHENAHNGQLDWLCKLHGLPTI